jgi:D-alanyl-D-alanine carboxypeptidase
MIRRGTLRLWPALGLVLVAALLGGLALGDDSVDRKASDRVTRTTGSPAPKPPESQLYAVRRRGGVPGVWGRRLRRSPGVAGVSRTARTQLLLVRSTRAAGKPVDRPPAGYAIPLDALVVRPKTYVAVLPAEARGVVGALRPGRALLTRTSARVRRLSKGDRIRFASGRTLRVSGVIADHLARDAELVLHPGDAEGASARSAQLLVATMRPVALARSLPHDDRTRISPVVAAPAERRGGIVRAVDLKARFGEFAVRLPYGEDWIEIEPGWVREHIVTRSVPTLGGVTCHRALIRPLRRALAALDRRGLAGLVNPADYAGCYAPRRIPGSGALSLHAWGLAIDLNAAANPQFGRSRQDRRLVRAMERAGFTWGGRWPTAPDPMHFELQGDASSRRVGR